MFEVDPQTTWIDPTAGPISSLVQSLNTPLVAAGPHPAENVQAWIVSRVAAGGSSDVLVYFHLTQANLPVVYRWADGAVPPPQLAYVQEEALSFCESMGFMMDNLNFAALSPEARGELLQTLPPFTRDLSSLVKEMELVESSSSKKLDPLDDFVRMKQARAEAGQLGTGEFMSAQGDPVHEPQGDASGPSFDPSLRVDRADAPNMLRPGDEPIEITEIEGLELLPDPELVRGVVASDPPVVRGSIPDPSPVASPRMVREKTPSESMKIFDESDFADPELAMAAAPIPREGQIPEAGAIPSEIGGAEMSIDDMLADVGNAAPGGDDLSSELDAILDRVEGSSPSVAEPAMSANGNGHGSDDISIELSNPGDNDDDDDAMKMFDALVAGDDDPPPPAVVAPPSTMRAPAPPPISPTPSRLGRITPVAVPASEAIRADAPVSPLESAWMDGGASTQSNGNGASHGGSAPRLDIATDDLARLLAML